jgi:hypothetical protein
MLGRKHRIVLVRRFLLLKEFIQQNIDKEPIIVLNNLSNKVSDALDGNPFFTIAPEDKRKNLERKYKELSETIDNYYAYATHPKIESYLLAEDYLQGHAGEAVQFKANLAWLNRDSDQLYEILVKDFPAIDKKYKLLIHVLNIDYYYHEISRYAHDGDSKKASQLYEALKSIRNYSGMYVIKKDLKTLDELKDLWYFDV